MSKIGSEKKRITYLEPNALPGERALTADNVKADNITWPQEDLSIMVDLQVAISPREYREANMSRIDPDLDHYHSIISGAKLNVNRKEDTVTYDFLTDEYTNVSYQEIKNNNAGSRELFGINSINITFDSHLYPRVTMNFTDVRGSSLMMPQEQYYYDMNSGVKNSPNDTACKNFFQSVFKFPYPKFYLSVKGIYGTCVTFVLSVEDFKATFNSESGNFDVVITFIGYMYGLYTDIPMNYLLVAPFINGINENGFNDYWTRKKQDGTFTYSEKGDKGSPILSFMEFRERYTTFLSTSENLTMGEKVMQVAALNGKAKYLRAIMNYFDQIPSKFEKPIVSEDKKETQVYSYRFYSKPHHHLLVNLNTEAQENSFIINEEFAKKFKEDCVIYGKTYSPGNELKTKDVFVQRLIDGENVFAALDFKGKFFGKKDDNGKYQVKRDVGLSEDECSELENILNGRDNERLSLCKYAIVYSENFKEYLSNELEKVNEEIEEAQVAANDDVLEAFRTSFGFSPTIENIMRMTFAHLDTFLHEFYSKVKDISTDRTIEKIKWDIERTDIESLSGAKAFVPPFTAFYNHKRERVYPGTHIDYSMPECDLVEMIFTAVQQRLQKELEKNNGNASSDEKEPSIVDDQRNTNWKFTPIAVTDVFYEGKNPYSMIDVQNVDFVSNILYFMACRLTNCNINYKFGKRTDIYDIELSNLQNSTIWKALAGNEEVNKKVKSIASSKIHEFPNDGRLTILTGDKHKVNLVNKITNETFIKFNGLKPLTKQNAITRESIAGAFTKFEKLGDCYSEGMFGDFYAASLTSGVEQRLQNEQWYYYDRISENKSLLRVVSQRVNDSPERRGSGWWPVYDPQEKVDTCERCVFKSEKEGDNIVKIFAKKNNYKFLAATQREKITETFTNFSNMVNSVGDSGDYMLWCPYIEYKKDKKNVGNVLVDVVNNKIYDDYESNKYARAFWFLDRMVESGELISPYYGYSEIFSFETIAKIPKVLYYHIAGYCYCVKNGINVSTSQCSIIDVNSIPQKYYDYLSKDFTNWFYDGNSGFRKIEEELKNRRAIHDTEKYFLEIDKKGNSVEVISPDSELNKILVDLLTEEVLVCHFTKTSQGVWARYGMSTSSGYIELAKRLYDILKDIPPTNSKSNGGIGTSDVEDTGNGMNISEEEKTTMYYTLKNLYDRWLATFKTNDFILRNPQEEHRLREKRWKRTKSQDEAYATTSEFDNFLYVDSFYNDIGEEFYVNPQSFFQIVNEQAIGSTNFSVLEFIGRICEKNKLLFRCLPVYNNLYSLETFKEAFTPHTLYNGSNYIKRKVGNTYLLMYTYESSHHADTGQDKEIGVGFANDGFDLGDTFGNISPDAENVFKDGGYPVTAFAVTPGMQNQSYFTKVSIGMDNPRVTDYAIMNKFALADMSKGLGTANGIGTGQDLYPIYSNRAYDCKVEMLGCANIMPMMYFQLNNVPIFKGAYMITKVEHTIQNNTMTTSFTGTRMPKWYIPYNKQIFNLSGLMEMVKRINDTENKSVSVTVHGVTATFVEDGSRFKRAEGAPMNEPPKNGNKYPEFNVWAATNQMHQIFHPDLDEQEPKIKKMSNFRPINDIPKKGEFIGRCATAVQGYLFAGFNGVTPADTEEQAKYFDKNMRSKYNYCGCNGYDMHRCLADHNFQCIAVGRNAINKFNLQIGDVCVMKDGSNGVGHVCMYTGNIWVSDFRQSKWWVYSLNFPASNGVPPNEAEGDVLLYRFAGIIVAKEQYYGAWQPDGSFVVGAVPRDVKTIPVGN